MKIPDNILEKLCHYDSRNPDNILDCLDVSEEDYQIAEGDCLCDNCFYGRTKLAKKLVETLNLLGESVAFMNLVPNNKYGDNYELCSRIDKFLKGLE